MMPAHAMQERWREVKAAVGWNNGVGDEGAHVLRVIGHAAARFPPAKAASLSHDLLKVSRYLPLFPMYQLEAKALLAESPLIPWMQT